MESFGAYLKDERESRKISLDEISRATKIRRAILEAIERDEGEVLLPEAVVKGFIRTYARHIGLDPKEVMATYAERQKGDEAPEKGRPLPGVKRRIPVKYVFAGGICVLIIIIIPLLFFSKHGSRKGAHEAALATIPTEQTTMVPAEDLQSSSSLPSVEEPMPLQTPPVGAEEVEEVQKEKVQNVQEVQEVSEVPEVTEVPEVSAVEAGEEVVAVQEEEPTPVHDHTLVITASERTWIQIQEGSSLPFDVILYPGDSFTRTSSQQLAVVIGNAGGVAVSFDGKRLDYSGKDGEVVRLTLPSPEEG
jgi:cytoskeleton protein RodZ